MKLKDADTIRTGLDVGDERVGDHREGNLGHVELVLGDQAEEQVEGPLEVREAYGERRRAGLALVGRLRQDRGLAHESLSRAARSDSSPRSSDRKSTRLNSSH